MTPILKSAFRPILFLLVAIAASAMAQAQTAAPPNAVVYFINVKDGDTVKSPFKIQFGLSGMGIAPAGVEKPNTGHHHLLIDTTLTPEQAKAPIPADDHHLHWRRTDRNDSDPSAGPSHVAARARRLVARSLQPADRDAGDHGQCEVTVGVAALRWVGSPMAAPAARRPSSRQRYRLRCGRRMRCRRPGRPAPPWPSARRTHNKTRCACRSRRQVHAACRLD
jgi:hypothetical protein